MSPEWRHWAGQAGALVTGLAGGFCAYLAGLPLPWMLGSMIAVTTLVLLHAPLRGPDRLRLWVIPVIGVMLGSGLTPSVLDAAVRWAWTLALLPPFLILAGTLSYTFYRRIGGYDPVTAYFSAMPGGLNDMLLLGGAAGGDEKRIALAHASRVLLVVTFVVLFFGSVYGVRSQAGGGGWIALADPTLKDWAFLAGSALLGVPLGRAMRLPAAPILGPMVLSGIAHVSGQITIAPPGLLVIAAQVVIGTVIGCRFLGTRPRDVALDLILASGSSLLMLCVAVGFSVVVVWITGVPLSQAFLAYSPGGLTEMGLLAYSMDEDVGYVSVMHLVRITLVIFCALPIFSRMRRRGLIGD